MREAPGSAILSPRDVVSLQYSQVGASRPSTSLTFPAQPQTPIMLLEDIDFLIDTVACTTDNSIIAITFGSDDAYAATFAAWSSLEQFMLVTAHFGCNPHDQRGAWRVLGVVGENDVQKVVLAVQPVPLRRLGEGYRIIHNTESVVAAWGMNNSPQLLRRAEIDNVTQFDWSIDFEPRQQLIPITNTQLGSTALVQDVEDDIPEGLEVFCTNCVSTTKFSIGMELLVSPALSLSDPLKVEKAYVNLTIEQFEQDISLEISFNDSMHYSKDIDIMLIPFPDLGMSISGVADVGFFWGGAVRGDLEIGGELNFTVGASATIPSGTSATFNFLNESSASGWDDGTFDVHPFRLNSGQFSATGNLALSPFLQAAIDIDDSIAACEPLGPDDYEYFDVALTFGAGLNLTIDATVDTEGLGSLFLNDSDTKLFAHAISFSALPPLATPECMVVVDDQATTSLAGEVVAATGTLVSAASAIPSFNVSAIQSYYSANSALPTGVNYSQMLKATAVPSDILKAVQKASARPKYAAIGRPGGDDFCRGRRRSRALVDVQEFRSFFALHSSNSCVVYTGLIHSFASIGIVRFITDSLPISNKFHKALWYKVGACRPP
ncbi:hypothetical protein HMN09_00186400 [Mycena chlorophos]|uniref:DUF7029 domain-containing protein n=1 Tax=Mycena chlorophos TaxID=658473 RepID=A0A8H6TSK8_MYCCL|nr:hypothetical protein HMN09_00186400 [Mycena chlorophos]